jgi:hypothetical protein
MARQRVDIEQAEAMMVEAWELLMRLPDRERGFLSAGSRSGWPDTLREAWEYPDADERPRLQLNRREMALVGRVFLDPGCLTMEIAADNRRLVALVLAMIAREGRVWWDKVFIAMGGKRIGVTSDALRRRYERSLARIAVLEGDRLSAVGGSA